MRPFFFFYSFRTSTQQPPSPQPSPFCRQSVRRSRCYALDELVEVRQMNEKKVQQQQQNNFNIYAKEMPLFHIPLLILLAFLTFERVHAQVLVETCLAEGKSDFKVTSSKSCPCNMRALVRANASTSGIAVTVAALPVDTYQKWRNLNAQRHDTIVPLPKDHNIINVAQLPFSTFTNRTWKLDTAPLLSSLEYKFVTIFRRAPISSSSRATGKGNGNGNGNPRIRRRTTSSAARQWRGRRIFRAITSLSLARTGRNAAEVSSRGIGSSLLRRAIFRARIT